MSKLSSRPPKPKVANIDDFISAAEQRTNDAQKEQGGAKGPLPWEDPRIRDDVLKPYNLRFPEAYLLKLKFIAEHTPQSMHAFCLSQLLPAIDRKVEELLAKRSD